MSNNDMEKQDVHFLANLKKREELEEQMQDSSKEDKQKALYRIFLTAMINFFNELLEQGVEIGFSKTDYNKVYMGYLDAECKLSVELFGAFLNDYLEQEEKDD